MLILIIRQFLIIFFIISLFSAKHTLSKLMYMFSFGTTYVVKINDMFYKYSYKSKNIFVALSKKMNLIYQHHSVQIHKEHLSNYSKVIYKHNTSKYHKTVFEFFFCVFPSNWTIKLNHQILLFWYLIFSKDKYS